MFNPYNHSLALIGDGFIRANVNSLGGTLRNSLTVSLMSPLATSGRRRAATTRHSRRSTPARLLSASATAPNTRAISSSAASATSFRPPQRDRARALVAARPTRTTDRSRRSTHEQIDQFRLRRAALQAVRPARPHARRPDRRNRRRLRPSTPGARRRPPYRRDGHEAGASAGAGQGGDALPAFQPVRLRRPRAGESFGLDAGIDQTLFDGRADTSRRPSSTPAIAI